MPGSQLRGLIRDYVRCVVQEARSPSPPTDERILNAMDVFYRSLPKGFSVEPVHDRKTSPTRGTFYVMAGKATLLRMGVDPDTNGSASLSDGLVQILERLLDDEFDRTQYDMHRDEAGVEVFISRIDDQSGSARGTAMASFNII